MSSISWFDWRHLNEAQKSFKLQSNNGVCRHSLDWRVLCGQCVKCGKVKVLPTSHLSLGAVFWSFWICLLFRQVGQLFLRVRTHLYFPGQQKNRFREKRVFSQPGCPDKRWSCALLNASMKQFRDMQICLGECLLLRQYNSVSLSTNNFSNWFAKPCGPLHCHDSTSFVGKLPDDIHEWTVMKTEFFSWFIKILIQSNVSLVSLRPVFDP